MNFPILSSIIFLPLLGALFIFYLKIKLNNKALLMFHLFTSIANLFLTLFLWYSFDRNFSEFQFVEEKIG